MNARRRALLAGALAVLPAAALRAQGFAGLGETATDFTPVTAPARLAFPRDHGPHPDFRIEWWYLTATLREADGTEHGIQWTLFRNALTPGQDAGTDAGGWASPQLWLGHAALTGADRHLFAETRARGGIGQVGSPPRPSGPSSTTGRSAAPARRGRTRSTTSPSARGATVSASTSRPRRSARSWRRAWTASA